MPGAVVTVAAKSHDAVPNVTILVRENDLVAVSKPAGIPTIPDHAGASHALVARVARELGLPVSRLHPTSRLDREVSGVVVIALSASAAQRLKRAREEGSYTRRYVALAERAPKANQGVWDAAIGRAKDPRHRAAFRKGDTAGGGRAPASAHAERSPLAARTLYRTIEQLPCGAALLAVSPITGRTHQIRVHASDAGAPLLGDKTYGGPSRITLPSGQVLPLSRIALHAARVEVPGLRADAPIPADLVDLWVTLGGDPNAWDTAVECTLDA
jgi:23S rRNA-/tRNA-specific pseudouridylate synthase